MYKFTQLTLLSNSKIKNKYGRKKKADKEDLEKCGECKLDVTRTDKAIQCEICELWFHCKCEDMLDETYKVVKQNKIHFFCGRCDKSVGKILKTMVNLTIRQDKLEEDFRVNKAEVMIY